MQPVVKFFRIKMANLSDLLKEQLKNIKSFDEDIQSLIG